MKTLLMMWIYFFLLQVDPPRILTSYEDDLKAIIIFAPDNQSKLYNQSISMFTRDPLGLDQRNVKILEIFVLGGIGPGGESISGEDAAEVRKHYNIEPSAFNIILAVGHFEEIHRTENLITIEEIFKKFDQQE
jgi:hypothetical protein